MRRSARLLAKRTIEEQKDVTVDDQGGDPKESYEGGEGNVRSRGDGIKRKVECLGMDDSLEDRRRKLRRVVDDDSNGGGSRGRENEGEDLVIGDNDMVNVQVGATFGNNANVVEESETGVVANDNSDDDVQVVTDKRTLKERKATNEARAGEFPEIDPNDVREELPSALVHVSGMNLGPTAKSCGIPYKKALIGFIEYRGDYYPDFRGIVIPSCCVDDMNHAIKLREERKRHRGNISASRAEYLLEQKARIQELQKEGESERRELIENALKNLDWEEGHKFPYFFQNLVDRFICGEMMPYVVELRRCTESKMTVAQLKSEAREKNVNLDGVKLKGEIIEKLSDAAAECKSDVDALAEILESEEAHCVRAIVRIRRETYSLAERFQAPQLKTHLWERVRATATRLYAPAYNTLSVNSQITTEATSSFYKTVAEPGLDELVASRCASIIRKLVSKTLLKVYDWDGIGDDYLVQRLEEIMSVPYHRTATNKDSLMSVEELAKNAAGQFLVEVEQYKGFYRCARKDAQNQLQVIHAWLKTHGEGLFDNDSSDQLENTVFLHHHKRSPRYATTLPSSFIIRIRRLIGDEKATIEGLLPSSMIKIFAKVMKEARANVTACQNCTLSDAVSDLTGWCHIEARDFFFRLPFEQRLAIARQVWNGGSCIQDAKRLAMASPSMRSAVVCLYLEKYTLVGVSGAQKALYCKKSHSESQFASRFDSEGRPLGCTINCTNTPASTCAQGACARCCTGPCLRHKRDDLTFWVTDSSIF